MTPAQQLVQALPVGWQETSVGRTCRILNGGTPTVGEAFWGGDIPFVTPPDIRRHLGGRVDETERSLTREGVRAGSTLATHGVIVSTRAPIGLVARLAGDASFNQGCRVLQSDSLDEGYLAYVMIALGPAMQAHGQGTTFMELSSSNLKGLRVPQPDIHLQIAIAAFLDRETAKIDALIDQMDRLIGRSLERRLAVLDHLVDDLIGHAGRLRYVADVTVGIVVTPSEWYADTGVIALRGVNVQPERIVLDDVVHLTEEGHRLHDKSRLREGDVVVVRTGQAGAACAVPPTLVGANAIDLLIVRCRPTLHPEYLAAILSSRRMAESVKTSSVGAIQGHFNAAALKNVPVPVPCLSRQETFLKSWRTARVGIDAVISRAERAVGLLRERRAALITATVTGQLDIGGAA